MLNRIETRSRATDQEDTQIVTELMDDIRDIVTDYQVSGDRKLLLRPCLQTDLDGAPAGPIRSESQVDCK